MKKLSLALLFVINTPIWAMHMSEEKNQALPTYEQIKKFKAPAYSRLTEEEKQLISAENYQKNLVKSEAAVDKLAELILDEAVKGGALTEQEAQAMLPGYKEFMKHMRVAVLSNGIDKEIQVTDEYTACARAAQRLTKEEKNALQVNSFRQDQKKAEDILYVMAIYTYEELVKAKLMPELSQEDLEKFKQNFLAHKLKELQEAYKQ